MYRRHLTTCAILASAVTVFAKGPDPRLASAKTVWIQPADELGDDMPIAVCVAEHLPKQLPLTVATDREHADVILNVTGHLPGDLMRYSTGARASGAIGARLLDGTVLWGSGVTLNAANTLQHPQSFDLPCALADAMLDKLRGAMRDARDNTKGKTE